MKNSAQHHSWTLNLVSSAATAALAITVMFALAVLAQSAQAQAFTVIHGFTGADGSNPVTGLTFDRAGNLYGTTLFGGNTAPPCVLTAGCGTVFKLTHKGPGWVLYPLYTFTGGEDGAAPQSRVVFGPDGSLYGTTHLAGSGDGGTVFNLRPPAGACKSVSCPWTETVLFPFNGQFNSGTGVSPSGELTFDSAGSIYGTTQEGGKFANCQGTGCGVVYELTRSGGAWTENILYNFTDGADGGYPYSGVIFDHAGNLYGTASIDNYQGSTAGLVFELSPSGSGWTQTVIYHFQGSNDGVGPYAGLIFDPEGNLYGATSRGGSGNGGTVVRLTPSGDHWDFSLLYSLTGVPGTFGPQATLLRDSAGNLYGTSFENGAYGFGNVFKLSPSNGGWTYASLHDFTDGSDGAYPEYGSLVLDATGNLYGTAYTGGLQGCPTGGGNNGCGVVWEITP